MRRSPLRGRGWFFLGVVLAGAVICGGVLLASNFDIAYLAGAMWLVLGTGVALAGLSDAAGRVTRAGRVVLAVAGVTLLVPAWQAGWQGTRALWGHSPLVRSELRPADDLPGRYAYFRGMSIPALLHDSLVALDRRLDELAAEGVPAHSMYFVNATEWLVRAVPAARQQGLPLWLHEGTTLGEPEARLIGRRLGAGSGIQEVLSLETWNTWTHGLDWYLGKRYRHDRVGPLFNLYSLKTGPETDWRNPLTFATATGSTAWARELRASGGPFELSLHPAGSVLGTLHSGSLEVMAPLERWETELVVRRRQQSDRRRVGVAWRLVRREAPGGGETFAQGRVELAPGQVEQSTILAAPPAGRHIVLELTLPPGEVIEAGIRRLQADHRPGPAGPGPGALDAALTPQVDRGNWGAALFAEGSVRPKQFTGAGVAVDPIQTGSGGLLFAHAPSEVWFRVDPAWTGLGGEFGLWSDAWTKADALPGVVARVVGWRPGRLEILSERTLQPRTVGADRVPQSFAATLPPGTEWVGLVFTSLDSGRYSYGYTWWQRLRVQ